MKTVFKIGAYLASFGSVAFVGYLLFSPASQELRDRERQFTAKVVSVAPVLLEGCYPSWQDPAPLLHVVLDRKVKIRDGYGDTTAETDHLFALMIDYFYLRGDKEYTRVVDYRQVLENQFEIPRTWNYFAFRSETCADTVFVNTLNWRQKYQQP